MEDINRVVIDNSLCTGCGLCATDCPARAISLESGSAEWVRSCIGCGHCVAICPVNAITMPGQDMDDVTEFDADTFGVDPEKLLNAMKYRRSVRDFTSQPVPEDVLMRILQAGRHAPTAKNVQDIRLLALQADLPAFRKAFWDAMPQAIAENEGKNPELATAMGRFLHRYQKTGQDPLFFNAPVVLLVFGGRLWDAGLVAGYMENMAVANDVGILHDGFLQFSLAAMPQLLAPYGLQDCTLSACMLAGYPTRKYARTAPRKHTDLMIR